MKVAVTTKGNTLDAPIDPRFGRAQKFIIVDTENENDFEVIDNTQNLEASGGAGIQAAQNVASKSIEALITGHCGPNAFKTLSAVNIKVFEGATGTVKEMLEKLKKGELKAAGSADVEGHW